MYNHLLYLLYWFVNAVIIYVFGVLFPDSVVLGNFRFSPIESSIYSGFWATFIIWVLWDFAIAKGVDLKVSAIKLGYFFTVNAFAIWLIARLSHITGFGIASFLWAFVISLFVTPLQELVRKIAIKNG